MYMKSGAMVESENLRNMQGEIFDTHVFNKSPKNEETPVLGKYNLRNYLFNLI